MYKLGSNTVKHTLVTRASPRMLSYIMSRISAHSVFDLPQRPHVVVALEAVVGFVEMNPAYLPGRCLTKGPRILIIVEVELRLNLLNSYEQHILLRTEIDLPEDRSRRIPGLT
jgi:hypothetical protein